MSNIFLGIISIVEQQSKLIGKLLHIVHDHLSPETKAKVDNAFSVIQQVTAEADKDLKIAQSIAPLPAVVTAEAVIGIALNAENSIDKTINHN